MGAIEYDVFRYSLIVVGVFGIVETKKESIKEQLLLSSFTPRHL